MKDESTNPKDRIGLTKLPLHLIPPAAMTHAALAHLEGSLKYGEYNWRHERVAAMVYIDAALRHIMKWTHGAEADNDSGLHHLGHAIACLNILLDAIHFGNMIDDRPPSDGSDKLIDDARKEVVRLQTKYGANGGKKEKEKPSILGNGEWTFDGENWIRCRTQGKVKTLSASQGASEEAKYYASLAPGTGVRGPANDLA